MKISILKRTGSLIATILFTFITYGMLQGTVQDIIPFINSLSEIGFTIITILLTFIFGFLTVTE